MTEARKPNGQFVAGWSGGPGRPVGQRNKLSEGFLGALASDFAAHGAAAIAKVRNEKTHVYLSVIASLCPRELHVERQSPFSDLSDSELDLLQEFLTATRARPVTEIEQSNGKADDPQKP